VHLHGSRELSTQLRDLRQAGVYKAAISTSWELQNNYRSDSTLQLLFGLMFPCPNGKVPYSLQPCYTDQQDWPSVKWVEQQLVEGKIDYFGEILSQYYGISSSDSLLFPYYALAQKYHIPVGIHTGGAGPNHGSPNFKMELGNPLLLKQTLSRFPALKVWIMHSGDQFYKETIVLMRTNKKVYSDISVISNPDIVPPSQFTIIIKAFIEAGLEDRLLFGTDNGDIKKVIASVEALEILSEPQKEKIFYRNAERFFASRK
jgi:predicted TIM-barrel fold metal-dependent hydrolase